MASMLKSGKDNVHTGLAADGCSCCNTRQERRTETKIRKRKEEREWKRREKLDN